MVNLEFGVNTPSYNVNVKRDLYPNTPTLTIFAPEDNPERQRVSSRMELNAKAREVLGLKGKKAGKGESEFLMPARIKDEHGKVVGIVLINSKNIPEESLDDKTRAKLIRFGKNSSMSNKPLYSLIADFIGKEEITEDLILRTTITQDPNYGSLLTIDGAILSSEGTDEAEVPGDSGEPQTDASADVPTTSGSSKAKKA